MYNRILVPLDGSTFSESVLEQAKAIARGCHVPEVVLLTVLEPYRGGLYRVDDDFVRNMQKEARTAATNYLNQLVEKLGAEGIHAQAVIIEGTPADIILSYAENNQVDLIIMSTHGRGGISRWVFGSVAERVVRSSVVPVLLAPPSSIVSS